MAINLDLAGPWWLRWLGRWAMGRSFRTLERTGRAVGRWVYHLLPIRRWTILRRNLARGFPDRPSSARALVARQSYEALGASVFELLGAPQLLRMAPDERARVVRIDGREHLERALARGRGVVIATAHLGAFDLAACACALDGVALHVVTKRLKSRGVDAYWQAARAAMGVRLHEARGSMPALLAALRANECVAMMIDQRVFVRDGGALVPFFGAPCETTVAPAVLSARAGAPVVMARCVRAGDGTYRVALDPPLDPPAASKNGGRDARVALMAALTARLEQWVREAPGEWLWLHDRWRRAPESTRRAAGRALPPAGERAINRELR